MIKFTDLALANLKKAKTANEIIEELAKYAAILGANYFQILALPDCPILDWEKILIFGNYPDTIKDYYKSEQSALFDPCRSAMINNNDILKWRRIFVKTKAIKEREFIAKLREHGMYDGISLPIHNNNGTIAMLNFAGDASFNLTIEDEDFLRIVALLSFQRIKFILAQTYVPRLNIKLTNREKECLSWVLHGKTNWEIAIIIGKSERTAAFHLANAQIKLGAANRIESAFKAYMGGLIISPNGENIL